MKSWIAPTQVNSTVMTTAEAIIGTLICKAVRMAPAPSTTAASTSSRGTACSAA